MDTSWVLITCQVGLLKMGPPCCMNADCTVSIKEARSVEILLLYALTSEIRVVIFLCILT